MKFSAADSSADSKGEYEMIMRGFCPSESAPPTKLPTDVVIDMPGQAVGPRCITRFRRQYKVECMSHDND